MMSAASGATELTSGWTSYPPRGFRQTLIDSGTYSNTIELADAIGKDPAYVSRLIRLTLLAPEIVHAILTGTLQRSVSMETLRKELPVRWADQKKLFGVE